MSRDLFTNWAGEKSSAPLRGGRAAEKGDRKRTGISSLCLENAFYPLCLCSREARPEGVRKTALNVLHSQALALTAVCHPALPLPLLPGKKLDCNVRVISWTRRLEESGWRQEGVSLVTMFEDRQRNLWLSVIYNVSLHCFVIVTLQRGKKMTKASDNNFTSSGDRWWSLVDVKDTLQIFHILCCCFVLDHDAGKKERIVFFLTCLWLNKTFRYQEVGVDICSRVDTGFQTMTDMAL